MKQNKTVGPDGPNHTEIQLIGVKFHCELALRRLSSPN